MSVSCIDRFSNGRRNYSYAQQDERRYEQLNSDSAPITSTTGTLNMTTNRDAFLNTPWPASKQCSDRTTVASRLAATGNRPSGFDYMRLLLAIGIIAQHSHALSYDQETVTAFFRSPARAVVALILPMFFALSGFLVASSLERCKTLISFLSLRALRIVPALAIETTLSALLLGCLFTNLPLRLYFTDPYFASYFLNIIGKIHYLLPGLFLDNPVRGVVNGQLWTIPYELKCYIYLAAIALAGIAFRKHLLLGLMIVAQIYIVNRFVLLDPQPWSPIAPGEMLVLSFLAGVTLFKWRDRLPWSLGLCVVCASAAMALLLIPNGDYFIAFPVAYATVYLGLLSPPRHKLVLSGDYSYGIFLYGFPIQQAVAMWPFMHEWYWNFLATAPVVAFIAVGSWWVIERPALNLRRHVTNLEAFALKAALVRWLSRFMHGGGRPFPLRHN